jgi:hypothetical protein
MGLALLVTLCWWRPEHWLPKRLQVVAQGTVAVLALINVLHLVDVMLERRGGKSTRRVIWQKLGWQLEKTSVRNVSNGGSL